MTQLANRGRVSRSHAGVHGASNAVTVTAVTLGARAVRTSYREVRNETHRRCPEESNVTALVTSGTGRPSISGTGVYGFSLSLSLLRVAVPRSVVLAAVARTLARRQVAPRGRECRSHTGAPEPLYVFGNERTCVRARKRGEHAPLSLALSLSPRLFLSSYLSERESEGKVSDRGLYAVVRECRSNPPSSSLLARERERARARDSYDDVGGKFKALRDRPTRLLCTFGVT